MSPRRPLNRNFPQFTEANPSIFCSAWVNKHFQTSAEVVVSMLLSELWPVTFHNSCLTEVLLCLFEPFLLSLPLFVSFSLFQMHIHANTHTQHHTIYTYLCQKCFIYRPYPWPLTQQQCYELASLMAGRIRAIAIFQPISLLWKHKELIWLVQGRRCMHKPVLSLRNLAEITQADSPPPPLALMIKLELGSFVSDGG